MSEFICRFGVPRQLHSDQGPNFESKVFAEVCRLLDIDKTCTTPLHPQSDGQPIEALFMSQQGFRLTS